MSTEYTVRAGRREDMQGLLKLAQDEGWNSLIEHLHCQFDAFPQGVFVAENSDGEIISHCASAPLDESNGFMAYYVTKKSCRGQGIGRQVFDLSVKALGNRNILLNAFSEKKEMYAAGHFKAGNFTSTSYKFQIKNLLLDNGEKQSSHTKITNTKDVGVEKIIDYDKKIHPPRERFLKWVLDFAYVGLVAMEGDEVKGWGTVQKSRTGYRLMPLYSDTPEVAEVLAKNLLKQLTSEPEAEIELCCPEDNSSAKRLCENIGVFNGNGRISCKHKRMFTEKDIPVPTDLVYSILQYDQVLV